MFASFPRNRNQRRGVVLVLVLGMLGLLALIGVTFATFSGQVKVNSKNFSQAQNWPESAELMDYALSQLIDDTDNPMSAIRGHSLKRDMYGNDGLYNAALRGLPSDGTPFQIVSINPVVATVPPSTFVTITDVDGATHNVAVDGLYEVVTNIPVNEPSLYGYNFTRWVMRFPSITDTASSPYAFYPSESHEILADYSPATGARIFYVAPDDNTPWPTGTPMPPQTVPMESSASFPAGVASYSLAPTIPYPLPSAFQPITSFYQTDFTATTPPIQFYDFYNVNRQTQAAITTMPGQSKLIGLGWRATNSGVAGAPANFILDGRFLHAFNGPGVAALDPILRPIADGGKIQPGNVTVLQNRGMGQYANYRVNGNILTGNINTTDNFQTGFSYGSPSLCGMDEDYDACDLENWFLALQSGDSQVMIPSFHRPGILVYDNSITDPVSGTGVYDDWASQNPFSASKILRPRKADGHNAIAFRDLKPNTDGTIDYDVDNDGDGVTDSVWLDLGYPPRRNTDGRLYKPLYAFMIIGLNGRIPLNTAGNLQLRTLYDPAPSSLTYAKSLGEHASSKGYSTSEIDPTYALQNAFNEDPTIHLYSPVDNAGATTGGTYNETTGVYVAGDGTQGDPTTFTSAPWWGTAGVPVSTTQLRNLLAGTRPAEPYLNASGVLTPTSHDANFVVVNGKRTYLPNGVVDMGDVITTVSGSTVVQTTTHPVEGRWGEGGSLPPALATGAGFNAELVALPEYLAFAPFQARPPRYYFQNEIRAGVSGRTLGVLPARSAGDARDDNYNSFDWFPANVTGATVPVNAGGVVISTLGENADFLDASGSVSLAVERFRRFVTPIDVMGDGFVNRFKGPLPTTPGAVTSLLGADADGHVAHVKHFRPPGLAIATPPGLGLPPAPLPTTEPGTSTSPIWYPYGNNSTWLSGVGKPAPPWNSTTTPPLPADQTTNLYHGMESYRMPTPRNTDPTIPPALLGGMLSNFIPAAPAWTPTFDQFVNTGLASAHLNEADEMNPYSSQAHDHAFGPVDLEWLYRYQDTDGVSLSSRLKELAPISFTNPADGTRRRRMFSVETWEPTTFVWAHDNPADNPEWALVTEEPLSAPYGNTRFFASYPSSPPYNSTVPALATQSANLSTQSYMVSRQADVYDPYSNHALAYTIPQRLPSIAHRDRKINLNFPLPPSNRYDEPVRQKWIRETYQLLKMTLPPKSVDTPEELAQLSQFVVNIIDFRDPDSTATRFVNTDISYLTPATNTTPATIGFTPSDPTARRARLGSHWNGTTNPMPPDYSPVYDSANSPYLVQYGMEYNPIAINEVLAFNFFYNNGGAPAETGKMWVELVNTLTAPAGATNANDLKLAGWDFVILPDTPDGRPDPITGQLPLRTLAAPVPTTNNILGVTLSDKDITTMGPNDPGGLGTRIAAMDPNAHYYTIESSDTLPTGTQTYKPDGSPDATIGLVSKTVLKDAATGPANNYYWLYLRRPANPFDASYDPTRPNENRVVVDAFRFIYNKARPTSAAGGTLTPTPVDGDIYSIQRLQPYRGGHAVPPRPAIVGAPNYSIPAYGYTEQASRATTDDESKERDSDSSHTYKVNYESGGATSTGVIYNSIGEKGDRADYAWDYFQFNDRDFTSVAELLMVPGCPPGLFTKQFVEFAPPVTVSSAPLLTPPAIPPTTPLPLPVKFSRPTEPPDPAGTNRDSSQPHTFPYLVDKFFYTGVSEPVLTALWPSPATGPAPIKQTANFNATYPITFSTTPVTTVPSVPNYIGGPSGAGWFKMFEFFDVPSPANGSIGTVAQGMNYDWARQDLKPGLLNINLIVDEEVFFSIMSETWLKTLGSVRNLTAAPFAPGQDDLDNMGSTRLNVRQVLQDISVSPAVDYTPVVVSQVNANGSPRTYYRMKNQGFMAIDPVRTELSTTGFFYGNRMKEAFSDFLKLRHGGSGYMFAHQSGKVGDPNPTAGINTTVVASERPYRSFSYPDVNRTLLRPAGLPPSTSTPFIPYMPSWVDYVAKLAQDGTTAPFSTYVGDPGVKNPYLFMQNNPVQPPPIPVRRLFQLPDVWGLVAQGFPTGNGGLPAIYPSNSSRWTTPYTTIAHGPSRFTGDPEVNWVNVNFASNTSLNLASDESDISSVPTTVKGPVAPLYPPVVPPAFLFVPKFYLGANTTTNPPYPSNENDNRQHPAFRYDWLHKVTNLTTVRTHQYAVWITVGFFEVTKQGDPMVGNVQPGLAYDRLGQELNIQSGNNTRYRSFFVIDRTRAVGFSPQAPGNFRECIVYRQPIE